MEISEARKIWENRLSKDWSLTGVGYTALGKGFNVWAYKVRGVVFDDILSRLTFPNKIALDIGSGTGFYVDRLLKRGFKVERGVDLSSSAVLNLKKRFPQVQFFEGTVADIIDSETYDVITAMDVLFHILDDSEYKQTFKKISTLLSETGYFVFSENFPNERISKRHHISREKEFIYRSINKAGLEIIVRKPLFCLMNQPIRKRKSLWWWMVVALLVRVPWTGWIAGPILYPLELILLWLGIGASSEIVVCRLKHPPHIPQISSNPL